jgi:hypothetical protein
MDADYTALARGNLSAYDIAGKQNRLIAATVSVILVMG